MKKPSKPEKKLFRVFGHTTVSVMTVVCAKDEDDAIAMASCDLPMLSTYSGNGGWDKLVGVDGSHDSVDAYEEIEFDDVELIPLNCYPLYSNVLEEDEEDEDNEETE